MAGSTPQITTGALHSQPPTRTDTLRLDGQKASGDPSGGSERLSADGELGKGTEGGVPPPVAGVLAAPLTLGPKTATPTRRSAALRARPCRAATPP